MKRYLLSAMIALLLVFNQTAICEKASSNKKTCISKKNLKRLELRPIGLLDQVQTKCRNGLNSTKANLSKAKEIIFKNKPLLISLAANTVAIIGGIFIYQLNKERALGRKDFPPLASLHNLALSLYPNSQNREAAINILRLLAYSNYNDKFTETARGLYL